MEKELIATVEIKQYVRHVVISQKRKTLYYEEGETVPAYHKVGTNTFFLETKYNKKKKILCSKDGTPVIKNPRVAGKQRVKVISGQDVHTLRLLEGERAKIVRTIKEQFIPEIAKLDAIENFPIVVECELHDTFMDYEYLTKENIPKQMNWDVDNRGLFYCKVFLDVLQGSPAVDIETGNMLPTSKIIIPDDDRRYITGTPSPLFFPIDNTEDRKLVFKIYKDNREVILNSKYYGKKE